MKIVWIAAKTGCSLFRASPAWNERVNEWVIEWMCEWVNESMREWVNELTSEWVKEWIGERVKGWMSELTYLKTAARRGLTLCIF